MLTTTLLSGKNKSFAGPRYQTEIYKKIIQDAKEQGIELSSDAVKSIIEQFFVRVERHMRDGDFIDIEQLGQLGMTNAEKRKRESKDDDKYFRMLDLKRKRERRKWKIHEFKLKWKEFNAMRESKGLKPWTYYEWHVVNHIRHPMKVYNTKNNKIK